MGSSLIYYRVEEVLADMSPKVAFFFLLIIIIFFFLPIVIV